jgi:hypothetical protein
VVGEVFFFFVTEKVSLLLSFPCFFFCLFVCLGGLVGWLVGLVGWSVCAGSMGSVCGVGWLGCGLDGKLD